MEPGNDLRRN